MDTENQIEIIPAPAALPAHLDSAAPFLPAIITASGPVAQERILEFFAANIRNPHTRRAYARQVMQFLAWCEGRHVTWRANVRPRHVTG